jgi:hypothetical protein
MKEFTGEKKKSSPMSLTCFISILLYSKKKGNLLIRGKLSSLIKLLLWNELCE